MKPKKPKTRPRQPTPRPRRQRAAPRARVQTFRDGSAVILDEHGGIMGMIEARPRYRVQRSQKAGRPAAAGAKK